MSAPGVGYLLPPACLAHDPGDGHPERPERLAAIQARIEGAGLLERLAPLAPQPAPIDAIAAVHTADHIERIRRACERAPTRLDPDTAVSSGSWEAALHAAGAAIVAADAVARGEVGAAFAAVRPPGHHAEGDRAMGFCLFNNIAIAARRLQGAHGLERLFVLDWDVHHGNGTQHTFEADATVFYFSTHQFPFYPGSGARTERGRGAGVGATLNVPMQAGSGDAEYAAVFRQLLVPAIRQFRPDAILISAGFDAHRDDPLAGMRLSEQGYGALTRIVREAAETTCNGRIVSLLEGGYDLRALGASVEAHLRGLGA